MSRTILNVDDSEGARGAKSRALQMAGFQVLEATTGRDALACVRTQQPDLVLLDMKLPDLSGLEVCRRIKEDPFTASVLVLQTSASPVGSFDKIRGLDGGADNYLAEPVEPEELVANVNALLRLRDVQRELRENEERFRQLAENITDVFWIFDPFEKRLLYASPAYEKLWERSAEALRYDSTDWLEGVHADDRERVRVAFDALLRFEDYELEYRLQLPGLRERWIRDRGFPVQNESGSNYRVARISEDITVQKLAEQALQQAAVRKDEFLATLAHELRNPLAPMRTAIDLMRLEESAGGDVKNGEAREIIGRQVDHLVRLVDDLLDVSRITHGKLALRRGRVELKSIVDSAMETNAAFLATRGQRLRVELPGREIWLDADGVRLAQALGNLLHNAGKYTPPGGAIELRATAQDPRVLRIIVADNGIGIAPDEVANIFELFSQVRRTDDQVPDGLGVGLSLVRELVELHGGSVHVSSPGLNRGSEFTIELPLMADVPASEAQPERPQRGLADGDSQPLKILLVDDSIDAVTMLGLLLRKLGHRVEIAHEGESAQRVARRFQPDIALLDIGLPGMDGYEVARALRQYPELDRTQLIALTGYGQARDRELALAAGFSQHLVKPIDFGRLMAVLKAATASDPAGPDRVRK